jgi:ABC-type phosphonate transport system ATPase subunit
MQNDPNFTRGGKRFRGNIEDTEQPWLRHREDTPERFSEGLREPLALLLNITTHTTLPPKKNTSARSSQGGLVGAL